MQYKVLHGTELAKFELAVSSYLREGWQLSASFQVISTVLPSGKTEIVFYQAIVKK